MVDGGRGRLHGRRVVATHGTAGDGLAIADDTLDDLVDQGLDHELFAVEEGDDGVGGVLDCFDEVGVDDQHRSVQAGHVDHRLKKSSPMGLPIFAGEGSRTHGYFGCAGPSVGTGPGETFVSRALPNGARHGFMRGGKERD